MKINKANERIRIQKRIDFWDAKLVALQDSCKHKNAEKTPRGDSGNIMTGRDPSYWYQCYCQDCGKRWWEDQ